MRLFWLRIFIAVLVFLPSFVYADNSFCYLLENYCGKGRSTRSPSAQPSRTSRININPSAVPTEKGFGIEVIGFKDSGDLGIVRGLGRVGAAISPSNSEETFFGAPGFEFYPEYLERKVERNKYRQQKYTFATAVNLWDRKASGLKAGSLNIGLMAKYNERTQATTPGGGLTGVLGPFSFGYSVYRDETLLEYTDSFDSTYNFATKIQSIIETYTIGMYLNSVILDYSSLRLQNTEVLTVELTTFSLLVQRWILSASQRKEKSSRLAFNFRTELLEPEFEKVEYFYSAQFKVTPNIMLGALYNYYLLREFAVSATILF